MHCHGSVPIHDVKRAIEILTSEEGAGAFRDIGKYTQYSRLGNEIHVAYDSFWGTTHLTMKPRWDSVIFEGTGPLGVHFGGSWRHVDKSMILEQQVHGVPRLARGMVNARIQRALEDLQKTQQEPTMCRL